MFGTPSTTSAFGTPASTPAFGTPSSTPAFGTPSSAPAFGTPSSAPAFGTPSSVPAFGTPSTPSFAASGFSSLFPAPSPLSQTQQQQQSPFTPFQQPQPFGFQTQPSASSSTFGNVPSQQQLTTQMAPVAPLSLPLVDRDIQAIVDAFRDEPSNPKYSFRHLLFSITDPAARVKPVAIAISDIMWAESMSKLEGMESADRERLWPQLIQGFKGLSERIKIQDEVIISDADRLRMTQANVKMLQRHFQADTLPWIQRIRQKELDLRRRLLRVMRIIESLEMKGYRLPLTRNEAELAEKLTTILKQTKGSGAELSRRVHGLLSISRLHANAGIIGSSICLPDSMKIQEQSLADLQEVLQQQTEAIARLGNVLKRDTRDMEIIMSEDADMAI